jgi:molybdenum cofactor cytidylyltransferase
MPRPDKVGLHLTLREALGVREREVVAFVGAGGKTTAMFRLSRELRAAGANVVVTTTTKIYTPPATSELRVLIGEHKARLLQALTAVLQRGYLPVVGRATTPDGKLAGVPRDWVADLAALPGVSHVLVEADGAARKPFKAPREGEPLIPPSATMVVPVVGVEVLGQPLSSQVAHRPEQVAALTGLSAGERLEPWAVARVLLDRQGNARGTPDRAPIVALVNKVDSPQRLAPARSLAMELQRLGAKRVVIAALECALPVVEVAE